LSNSVDLARCRDHKRELQTRLVFVAAVASCPMKINDPVSLETESREEESTKDVIDGKVNREIEF
jgi:hypothetical protein